MTNPPSTSEHKLFYDETILSITLNGRSLFSIMISPAEVEELVVGKLFSEQIITNLEEIESIRIENQMVSVLTKNPFKVTKFGKISLSGCGGSHISADLKHIRQISSDLICSEEMIQRTADIFLREKADQNQVLHTFGLVMEGSLMHLSVDLSRYVALDKCIGYALIHAIDLAQCTLVTGERVSLEIVHSSMIANIPVIITFAPITHPAQDLADRAGIMLVHISKNKDSTILSYPSRLAPALG